MTLREILVNTADICKESFTSNQMAIIGALGLLALSVMGYVVMILMNKVYGADMFFTDRTRKDFGLLDFKKMKINYQNKREDALNRYNLTV